MRMQASGSPDERQALQDLVYATQMVLVAMQHALRVFENEACKHETEFAFVADNSPSRNLVLLCPKASKVSKMARPSRKAAVIQGRCHSRASSWPPSSWPPSSWPRPTSLLNMSGRSEAVQAPPKSCRRKLDCVRSAGDRSACCCTDPKYKSVSP